MPWPEAELEWDLRYGGREGKTAELTAAEVVAAYRYLVLECTKAEAWRRIKLIRAAAK